jgi:hypothetical protein
VRQPRWGLDANSFALALRKLGRATGPRGSRGGSAAARVMPALLPRVLILPRSAGEDEGRRAASTLRPNPLPYAAEDEEKPRSPHQPHADQNRLR